MLLRQDLGQDDRCDRLHRLRKRYSAALLLLRGRLFLFPLLLHSLLLLLLLLLLILILILPGRWRLYKLMLGRHRNHHNHRTLYPHTTLLLILGPKHQCHRRSNHLQC